MLTRCIATFSQNKNYVNYVNHSAKGYDLAEANRYIGKIFANVAGVIYRLMENNEKCLFQITGVRSDIGEELTLLEVGRAQNISKPTF